MTLPFVINYLERIKKFKNQGFYTIAEYKEQKRRALKIEKQYIDCLKITIKN